AVITGSPTWDTWTEGHGDHVEDLCYACFEQNSTHDSGCGVFLAVLDVGLDRSPTATQLVNPDRVLTAGLAAYESRITLDIPGGRVGVEDCATGEITWHGLNGIELDRIASAAAEVVAMAEAD